VLVKQAKEKKMNLQHLEWYLKFFKYGVPPHGGFSIGLERILMQMVGLENVREATLFPRDTKRLLP
ncbi:aspartate--tRNA(Asn) ligase, partial [archaeon]